MAFEKFYSKDPSNPFVTVAPRELDVVHVPVRMVPFGATCMVVARTFRCYVADESAIVEYDKDTMCSSPLLFIDGMFTGKKPNHIMEMAQRRQHPYRHGYLSPIPYSRIPSARGSHPQGDHPRGRSLNTRPCSSLSFVVCCYAS